MSPTSPFSSQPPSGNLFCLYLRTKVSLHYNVTDKLHSSSGGSSVDPSVQTRYSAGTPRLQPCVSDISMGNSRFFARMKSSIRLLMVSRFRNFWAKEVLGRNQRLLVYDFVPNNTLHFHLHGHPRIIHRDIKSSNILLDNNFEAKVADFGLARLALDAVTHVTTRVMGTFGYMAPEYASSGKLTERSDVFSFGVVLLEIITGRRPVDASRPPGNESLVEWARPLLSRAVDTGHLEGLIDPQLEKNFNELEMFRMIEAAAACIRHSASRRPRMSQVMRVLDSLADIDLTNGVQPGQSKLFNVANTAEIRMFQRMVAGTQDDSFDLSQYSWSSRSRGGTDAAPSSRIL
ncbi:hypothetical protein PR202_ga10871 [Eleusine coracana subsp. coracana]|uniref:non-specific serine/threonine protein kinase n=1 Tax=Eleusine coracana subsp. coracana TaxID=191504 RepID=A0AAV5C7Q7_ELECO|nr:hypothetical protein PR202_ga10871 [Eleusine coracana subsp. coracana]